MGGEKSGELVGRRRLLRGAAALSYGLVPLPWLAPRAGQPTSLEGQFVQAPDGTVYLVAGGARYRLVPLAVSDAQLAALPAVGLIGTLAEVAALAGPPPEPATVEPPPAGAPAPAPPAPAPPAEPRTGFEALIGQSITTVATPNTNVTLRYEVQSVYTGYYDANSAFRFAIPIFYISNLGPVATRVGIPTNIGVQDENGASYYAADAGEQERWRTYLLGKGERVGDIYTPIAANSAMPVGIAFKNIPVGRTLKLVKV